ncbi:hypothetical protein [Actinoplanes sp. NPDC026670]|uniref:hypothetical protein n=1 Tax=Actinoplanes sp. NPDC026670 TaxID=3154700 RepID=UPI0033CA953B
MPRNLTPAAEPDDGVGGGERQVVHVVRSWGSWTDAYRVRVNASGELTPGQKDFLLGSRGNSRVGLIAATVAVTTPAMLVAWPPDPLTATALSLVSAAAAATTIRIGYLRLRFLARSARLRRKRVATGLGKINRAAEGAFVGTRRIPALPSTLPLPPDGWYRLAWLEPAGGGRPILLSAGPAQLPAPDPQPPPPPPAVTVPNDLLEGKLTAAQRRAQRRGLWGWTLPRVAGLIASGGALLACIAAVVTAPTFGDVVGTLIGSGAVLCLSGMGLASVLATVREDHGRMLALHGEVPVLRAAGPIDLDWADREGWYLQIDGKTLLITEAMAAELRVPGRYDVYYLPDHLARPGRAVLHIEALAAPNEPDDQAETD